ncbi:DUF6573 family protein [Prescottella subtropica]|uniref:DUF6573 family protein n=1 Tax=Prescottella subtropica TaxID=2545757 RepID=UPI0010F6B880|nr:DUF6573 family protein [Prescottella subtropica]
MNDDLTSLYGPVIASYTRADALTDGVLHDVTDIAREHGILLPTAIAAHAWAAAVAWHTPATAADYEPSRTWTVLLHAAHALRRAKRLGREGMQEFTFVPAPDLDETYDLDDTYVTLGIEVGPGDHGEAVLTITAIADR